MIGGDVIQCKSTLTPVYSLFNADTSAFLITSLSSVIFVGICLVMKCEDNEMFCSAYLIL